MLIFQLIHGECKSPYFREPLIRKQPADQLTDLDTSPWAAPPFLPTSMMYSEILDFHNVEGAEDQAQEGFGAVQDAQAQAQHAAMAAAQQS